MGDTNYIKLLAEMALSAKLITETEYEKIIAASLE